MNKHEIEINCIILKWLENEASDDELRQIHYWLDQHPDNDKKLEKLKEIYNSTGLSVENDVEASAAYTDVYKRLNLSKENSSGKYRIIIRWSIRAAAIFLLFIVIGLLIKKPESLIVYSNPTIHKLSDTLPDGSLILLNQFAKVVVDKNFNRESRKVKMYGEVFFDIVQDKSKPFIVDINGLFVKVTGTRFNIRNDSIKNTTGVYVESGKVQFYNSENVVNESSFKIDILPGELALCRNNEVTKQTQQDLNYLAWQTNILIFKQTPMSELIKTLENHFRIKINVALTNHDKYLVSARFKQLDAREIVRKINRKLNQKYKIDLNTITIVDTTELSN